MKKTYKKAVTTLFLSLLIGTSFSQSNNNAFRFTLEGNGYSDQAVIRMVNGATMGFDGSFDAWKMFSSNPNVPSIYTQCSVGQDLAINSLPEFTEDKSITIYTNIPVNGLYTLSFEELYALTPNYKISITEISSSSHFRLLGDTALVFNCTSQQNSPSFTFNISTPMVPSQIDETCFGENDGVLNIDNPGNNEWDIEFTDQNGVSIVNGTSNTTTNSYTNLLPGTYSGTITSKGIEDAFSFVIGAADNLTANFDLDKDTVYLSEGGVVTTTNNSQFAQNYFWDFDDAGIYATMNPSHAYSALGNYSITLSASNLNCSEVASKQVVVLSSPNVSTGVDENYIANIKLVNSGNGIFDLITEDNSSKNILIYDLTGKMVVNTTSSNQSERISLKNQAKGIYVLSLVMEGEKVLQQKIYNN